MSRQALTPAQQYVNLKASEISRGGGSLARGCLTWRYEARPTPMSRAYGLLLTYAAGGIPKVFVETPDLVALSSGRKVPHVYSEDPLRLCLYWPKAREWTSDMLVDRTVVPWSYLWLFFFEDWLSTGEWRGGGVHLGDDLPAIGVL